MQKHNKTPYTTGKFFMHNSKAPPLEKSKKKPPLKEVTTYPVPPPNIHPTAIIHPSAIVDSSCQIGANTEILPYTILCNCILGENNQIGPFAHLQNSIFGDSCRIGNYVEIKRSELKDFVKIAHLAYVGDARIGSHVNIGAGVVFCNYDGKEKHKTYVGNNCFIGSNSSLIAPLSVGENSFIAAGSVLAKDLPASMFYVSRPDAKIAPKR